MSLRPRGRMALLPLEAEIESLVLDDLLAAIDDSPNDASVRLPLARHPGANPLVVVNDRDRAVGRCLPQREVPCLADALDRFGFGDDVRQYPPPEATNRA